MSVALGAPCDRREKRDVVAENLGDRGSLILAARAQPTMVEFLQSHEIGRLLCDNPRDAAWRDASIHANAAMDVIAHDPQPRWVSGRNIRCSEMLASEQRERGVAESGGTHKLRGPA